jgi:hypothetical protein
MTNSSNLYRKVRALAAKTVAAGCTPHEHIAATNLAVGILAKHSLDAGRIDWPAPPPGFAWSGEPGRSEVVERPIEPKAKPMSKGKPSPTKPNADSTKPKRHTVGERLLVMLQRRNGATLDEITEAFGVQPHSARAIISVEIRKKRGLEVTLDRATGRYSVAG